MGAKSSRRVGKTVMDVVDVLIVRVELARGGGVSRLDDGVKRAMLNWKVLGTVPAYPSADTVRGPAPTDKPASPSVQL